MSYIINSYILKSIYNDGGKHINGTLLEEKEEVRKEMNFLIALGLVKEIYLSNGRHKGGGVI